MMTPLPLTAANVSSFPRSVLHVACATICARRATTKKKVSNLETNRTIVGFRRRPDMLAAETLKQKHAMQISPPLKISVVAKTRSN